MASGGPTEASYLRPRRFQTHGSLAPRPVRSLITWIGGGLLSIPLYPFPPAQNPGYEHVGQALRFCLSDLVRMKGVPAARGRHDFGLDLGEQTDRKSTRLNSSHVK